VSPEPAESPAATVTEHEVSAIPEPSAPQPEAVTSQAEAPIKQPEPVESAKTLKPAVAKHPPPKVPPKTAAVPAITPGAWVLQAGSFSQQANATSLRDRLKKSGYQASVQDVKSMGGHVYRVLIGPVSDRQAAEKLRDKLTREQKLTAMVIENK
jgi:cell division septation protein DedD